ncbi:MAG: hypothetical protein Q9216_002699 [Gyalolechia sp. 2 TL-2023]
MPSTSLRPRPSQQHLNESQAGKHHAAFAAKVLPQKNAVHRRDTPVNGPPDLDSLNRHLHPPDVSPSFRMNAAAPSTLDGSQLPQDSAGVPSTNGTHRPPEVDDASDSSSNRSYDTRNAAHRELPPLQAQSTLDEFDQMRPLSGDLLGSFDLVAPPEEAYHPFSLETRTEQLFSREHLQVVFSNPTLLLRFTAYLSTHRPGSVPLLIHYLDALKALRAIKYSNAVAEALNPITGHHFTASSIQATTNPALEDRAAQTFDALVEDDLPAYITHMYIQIVSLSISQRITGTLAPHLREASEGLAECFVVTDVNRPDNPIVFASEEFNRTTQYGMSYVIGRNCRFLQGPKTNASSVRRLREATAAGREHCEVFLNYRRDGSPFVNLLMIAPLCDSRGQIRYHIGAQVDVSGLVKDCTDLESFQQLLSEMLNLGELETVRRCGGKMHRESYEEDEDTSRSGAPHRPRLLLKEPTTDFASASVANNRIGGRLSGIFQHYLLIRPHPSLRILFASPTLRVPGILQSPFMNKIGGSLRVRDELTSALAEGRGVTAKVRWVTRADEDGRNRWIHCTPLVGSNGQIGVWMVILVDDDQGLSRRWKQAPPVGPHRGKLYEPSRDGRERSGILDEYTLGRESNAGSIRLDHATRYHYDHRHSGQSGSIRSSSPNSRVLQFASAAIALTIIRLFHGLISPTERTQEPPARGFEDTIIDTLTFTKPTYQGYAHSPNDEQPAVQRSTPTTFPPGYPVPRSNYSRLVVIPRMEDDDVAWISTEMPTLNVSIFVANDPSATLHPPKNKGHEVMIYLSYLIDYYDRLPDIVLFMHAHRWTHHNNLLLGFDASQMINSLNGAHVMREGYVNMRCHWSPGCPEWLRPTGTQDTLGKQEETVLKRCWHELFPFDAVPSFLAQPCCAQFALSKDRVRSIPRSRYIFYRDWILRTPLSDYVSGRIWEYSWQYLFTKDSAHCPAEHMCYCDGFGFCFGGEPAYQQYLGLVNQRTTLREESETRNDGHHKDKESHLLGDGGTHSSVVTTDTDRRLHLEAQIAKLDAEIATRRKEAQTRGAEPRLRAQECHRPWEEGDGF